MDCGREICLGRLVEVVVRRDSAGIKVKGCPASRPGRDAQTAEAGRYKCRFGVRADSAFVRIT
jgi:hypothetical protein